MRYWQLYDDSKNHYELTLVLVLANVFSSAAIRGASTQLRTAMEHVAGKAEELTKAKIKDAPPPPFKKHKTQSVSKFADWDPKKYATDRKGSRDKRAEKRHIRVFGMQKLGMVEYRKLMEEVDEMTNEPVDVMALVNKRIEELHEHLEVEEKEKQERERRQTQSKMAKLELCLRPKQQLNLLRSPGNEHVVLTTSTNLEVEPVPRNQNRQRVPRRKQGEKLQGQRSQSLKRTMLSTNRKIGKRNRLRKSSRVRK